MEPEDIIENKNEEIAELKGKIKEVLKIIARFRKSFLADDIEFSGYIDDIEEILK